MGWISSIGVVLRDLSILGSALGSGSLGDDKFSFLSRILNLPLAVISVFKFFSYHDEFDFAQSLSCLFYRILIICCVIFCISFSVNSPSKRCVGGNKTFLFLCDYAVTVRLLIAEILLLNIWYGFDRLVSLLNLYSIFLSVTYFGFWRV